MNYYNEIDPFKAEWLRELMKVGAITEGEVDERSITEVQPDDLRGFKQCHFFAGIGVWSYALRLANWPDDRPVWTGSCPCQSFSAAGKGKGFDDPRHLWPAWFGLICECRPAVLFGEQVVGAIGHGWLDLVQTDLEGETYAVGKAVLGACSVGAPHVRKRLWFTAMDRYVWTNTNSNNRFRRSGIMQVGRSQIESGDTQVSRCSSSQWTAESMPSPLAYGAVARVGRLRGYGDAIVPQVAAEFIQAASEAMKDLE